MVAASPCRLFVTGKSIQKATQGVSATAKVWSNTVRIPQLKLSENSCPIVTDLDNAVDLVHNFLSDGQGKTLVITGAGVSTDSGIPDYRGDQGTYVRNPKHRPILFHELASSETFRKRYWARGFLGWPEMRKAKPNPTHHILAKLTAEGLIKHIITQNVDGLHGVASAGLEHTILELHGSLHRIECLQCRSTASRDDYQRRLVAHNPSWVELLGRDQKVNPDGDVELPDSLSYLDFDIPPCTTCKSRQVKPQVVFFGENIRKSVSAQAEEMVRQSSSVLVIGSSLATYSSFRLLKLASMLNLPIGILCKGQTRADHLARWRIQLGCTDVLQRVDQRLALGAL